MAKQKKKPVKKRVYKKLTPRLKAAIKSDLTKYKDSELSGEALTYKHRVQGAKKARKIKKDGEAIIEQLRVPKDSDAYKMLQGLAKAKGVTVATLIKKYRKEIADLIENGGVIQQRESDYLIRDLNKLSKSKRVFVSDGNGYSRLSKEAAILRVQQLLMHCASLTNIFMIIYRVDFRLDGDMKFTCPPQSDYEELLTNDEITGYLDAFEPEIIYIESDRKTAD